MTDEDEDLEQRARMFAKAVKEELMADEKFGAWVREQVGEGWARRWALEELEKRLAALEADRQ